MTLELFWAEGLFSHGKYFLYSHNMAIILSIDVD